MARLPQPPRTVRSVLQQQQRQIRAQGTSSAFTRSGMNVTQQGVTSSDDFDGNLDNRDAGTTGWALGSKLAAFGDVIFRPRSIGDDALSSLVRQGFLGKSDTNWSLSPTIALRASASLTVPDGFTGALVQVTCSASAINSTAVGDVLYISTDINTWQGESMGGESVGGAEPGKLASASASGGQEFYDLTPGDKVTCAVRVHTNGGTWAASGWNIANMNVTVIWFR